MRPKELFNECFKFLVPNTSSTFCYIQDGNIRFRCEVYSKSSSESLKQSYIDFKNKLQLEGYFSFEDKSQSTFNQNEKAYFVQINMLLKLPLDKRVTRPSMRTLLKLN